MLCVVDDAQWLDQVSAELLALSLAVWTPIRWGLSSRCGTRLRAATSSTGCRSCICADCPRTMPVACSVRSHPVRSAVRRGPPDRGHGRESAGAGGAGRGPRGARRGAAEATGHGRAGGADAGRTPPGGVFLRRVRALPGADPGPAGAGSGGADRESAAGVGGGCELGIDVHAAEPAEAERLLVTGPVIGFGHPLTRSAVYHAGRRWTSAGRSIEPLRVSLTQIEIAIGGRGTCRCRSSGWTRMSPRRWSGLPGEQRPGAVMRPPLPCWSGPPSLPRTSVCGHAGCWLPRRLTLRRVRPTGQRISSSRLRLGSMIRWPALRRHSCAAVSGWQPGRRARRLLSCSPPRVRSSRSTSDLPAKPCLRPSSQRCTPAGRQAAKECPRSPARRRRCRAMARWRGRHPPAAGRIRGAGSYRLPVGRAAAASRYRRARCRRPGCGAGAALARAGHPRRPGAMGRARCALPERPLGAAGPR